MGFLGNASETAPGLYLVLACILRLGAFECH